MISIDQYFVNVLGVWNGFHNAWSYLFYKIINDIEAITTDVHTNTFYQLEIAKNDMT